MSSPAADPARWRRDKRPPRGKRPSVPVIKIGPGDPVDLVILSHELYGIWTHFVTDKEYPRGHTVACTGEGRECAWNHLNVSTRWQGWLCVARPGKFRPPSLVTLTFFAVRQCPELYAGGVDLRGLVLRLNRQGQSCLAPMGAAIVPETVACSGLSPAVQIEPQLVRMFTAPPRKAPSFRQLFTEAMRTKSEGKK